MKPGASAMPSSMRAAKMPAQPPASAVSVEAMPQAKAPQRPMRVGP